MIHVLSETKDYVCVSVDDEEEVKEFEAMGLRERVRDEFNHIICEKLQDLNG